MTSDSLSLTERLAHHVGRVVPGEAREKARLHLLDWLGCVAGARHSPVVEVAKAAEPDVLTRAALLGNVLEMDDVHRAALLHPGPVVWPAALAAVRETGGTFEDLLDGGVRGYEAVVTIGATFDAYHYARWHNSATAGGFGAAAAAASVLALDPQRTAWALGNSGSVIGGLWRMRHEAVMTKALHVAHTARVGLWTARLARAGFTGPAAILEGEQGLYAAMTEAPHTMVLGAGWRIDEISFKPWAACRHTHPAIDAALELRAQGALVSPVQVETYADALAFCDRPDPASVVDAKFSLQHAVAVVAVRGEPRPVDFEPDAIADPAIVDARALVTVAEAAEISARYPAHFGARLHAGGRTVDLADARGDPERPLSTDGVIAKARELVAWGGLAEEHADHALDLALHGRDPTAILAMLDDWL